MDMKDRLNRAYKQDKPSDDKQGFTKSKVAPAQEKPSATTRSTDKSKKAIQEMAKSIPFNEEALLKSDLGDKGSRKVAKFLLLLGAEQAANVLKHMKTSEIELISREIATIKKIDSEEARIILSEFGWLARTGGFTLEGGPDTAKDMLVSAFGEEKGAAMFKKAMPGHTKPFGFLKDLDPAQIVLLLKEESSHVMAIMLPYLEPKLASEVISRLNPELQKDVVRRIASLDKVSPEVIASIETAIIHKMENAGPKEELNEVNGTSVLANILRFMDSDTEESILDTLESHNPVMSQAIRDKLFTIDDILRVGSKDMQKALREFTEKDIALLIKGKSPVFREKLLACVSQNRKVLVLDEYQIMGAVRRDEVDSITREFLAYFKALYEAGKLVLEGDDDLVD